MRFIKAVSVAIIILITVPPVEVSPVSYRLRAFAVLSIFFLVISGCHIANIANCWGGGT